MIYISGQVKFNTQYKVSTETSYIQAVSTDHCLIKYWVTDYILYIESDSFEASLLSSESFVKWIGLQCELIKNKF